MVAAVTKSRNPSITGARRRWGITALVGAGFVVAGMVVLPWFIRTLGPRERLGSSFIETFDASVGASALYVVIVAGFVGVAFFAMSDPGRVSSWAGILLATLMLADGSWKMAEVLNAPAPTGIVIGPGYYALMAGAVAVLIASIMLLIGTYALASSTTGKNAG